MSAPTRVIERPLPHSAESERAFLSTILLGASSELLDLLSALDFFLPVHRIIFQHFRKLRAEGKPTNDSVILYESLADTKEIEEAGGLSYLSTFADGIPRTSNASEYARTIRIKSIVREKLYQLEDLSQKLSTANGNALEVLGELSALSAPIGIEVEQKRMLPFKTGLDLQDADVSSKPLWFARGLVAKGAITEVGAKIKTGKTTWLLEMVRSILEESPFLDSPTVRTPIVYLTEQPQVSFRTAVQRANLIGQPDFIVLSHTDTRGMDWPEVVSIVTSECKSRGASLLIVDTLSRFAGLTGDAENNAGSALEAMLPLERVAADGIGVVVVRHERKSGGDVGDSARGSSAFAGAVDVVLSLRKPEGNAPKNRRLLQSLSRFDETPNELLMELTDSGYVALGERQETVLKDAKDAIFKAVPEVEGDAATLIELAESTDLTRPTAQRAIDDLSKEGLLSRIGKGKKGNPFRYFISEMPFCSTSITKDEQKNRNINDARSMREPGDE